MPRLVVTKGPGTGRDHAVTTECVVGRGGDADFVVEDGNTSRRHCRVQVDGAGYAVEDLGSRNGTFVNGTRIQRQALVDGDIVRIGNTEFIFRQQGLIAPSTAAAARAIGAPRAISVPPAVSVPPALAVPRAVAVPPVVARPPVISVPAAKAPTAPQEPAPATTSTAPGPPPNPSAADPAPAHAPPAAPKPLIAPTSSKKRRSSW